MKKYCIELFLLVTVFSLSMVTTNALAGVSAEEAASLGKDLTPMGAIKAGNADGTIPAWEPMKKAPAGIKQPDNEKGERYPNPYPDEKPLFTITAQNYKDYADKLADGQKMMFKRYPDYRMDVYPSHRPYSVPDRIYDATIKNATRCSITEDLQGFTGAVGGIPFPIPKSGAEAMHNHLTVYKCDSYNYSANAFVVFPDGDLQPAGSVSIWVQYPFHAKETMGTNNTIRLFGSYDAPARRKGELVMFYDPADWSTADRKVWQYLTGQRRVRRAPSLAYDTPNRSTGNMSTYDDIYMFIGKLDRYNWKLKGRKEMFIRINNYKVDHLPHKDYLTGKFWNPDLDRWELHRVWEVEATLKEGKRHIYGRRTLYLDEDSWFVVYHDKFDNRGNLWRTQHINLQQLYGQDSVHGRDYQYYDHTTENYATEAINNPDKGGYRINVPIPDKYYTVEHMRRMGRR